MNSLLSRALELQRMAHELMYLDTNGSPIYSDEFCRLNKEVLTRSDSLFSNKALILKKRKSVSCSADGV